jgi:di/tricarboxylate transporter
VLLVGTAYMLLVGRRLLSASHPEDKPEDTGPTIDELVDRYGLRDKFRRLRIPAGSPLVGRTLGAAKLRTLFGVAAVGIERREGRQLSIAPALPQTEFRAGDVLYVTGHEEPAKHFVDSQGLEHLAIETAPRTDIQKELGLAEVMIPPDSELIKKTLQDAAFRSRHHVSVLAIRRGGEAKVANVTDERLKFGDTLLVSGSWKDIRLLRADKKNLIVLHLPAELADFAPARAQAPWALAILVAMIAAMTFDLMPNAIAVLMAALAMVLTRCLSMETAYKVINWPSLVLVAGMLPMATALQNSGATELIVDGLVSQFGDFGPSAMLAGLFALTAILGLFVSNTATAVLLAPIAIGIAADMGVSPYPFAMTIAVAASAAFMTPVSTPVNTLVVAPGGYTFADFAKVGVPMTILVMAVSYVLIPLLFPF